MKMTDDHIFLYHGEGDWTIVSLKETQLSFTKDGTRVKLQNNVEEVLLDP